MAEGICLLRFHTSCGAMLDMVVQLSREPAPWLPAARRLTTPTHRQIMATAAHFFILFCALKLKILGPTYEKTGARLECVKKQGPAEQYHNVKTIMLIQLEHKSYERVRVRAHLNMGTCPQHLKRGRCTDKVLPGFPLADNYYLQVCGGYQD